MRAERVAHLADGQAAQWKAYNGSRRSAGTKEMDPNDRGAYWPLGSVAPTERGLSDRFDVQYVRVSGQTIELIVRPLETGQVVMLSVDVADVSDDESLDLVHSLVFARVAEFVSSYGWDDNDDGERPKPISVHL